LLLSYKRCKLLGIAGECCESSQGQEDIVPHEPLKEAVVGLWYDDAIPKPNIKVIHIQMTLAILTDGLRGVGWDRSSQGGRVRGVRWRN